MFATRTNTRQFLEPRAIRFPCKHIAHKRSIDEFLPRVTPNKGDVEYYRRCRPAGGQSPIRELFLMR